MKHHAGWSLALLVLAWLLVGCHFSTSGFDPCESDADCTSGRTCQQGYCVPSTATDDVIEDILDEGDTEADETAELPSPCGECAEGTICCGSAGKELCVDPQTSDNHCGECDKVCSSGMVCNEGACGCPVGSYDCDDDGQCDEDILTDNNHCGQCGLACGANETCTNSVCLCGGASCVERTTCCAGVGTEPSFCANTDNDVRSCGSCEAQCGLGEECIAGACVCGEESRQGGAVCGAGQACCGTGAERQCALEGSALCSCGTDHPEGCAFGEACCDEACTDTQDDVTNCGACGVTCKANEVCTNGLCLCGGLPCPGANTCCPSSSGEDPFCTALSDDDANCGVCGGACVSGEACAEGLCTCGTTVASAAGSSACEVGFSCCSESCVNLLTDLDHCGECDELCKENEACTDGTCLCGGLPCPGAGTCCAPVAGDPLCTNLQNSIEHCGACFAVCGAGEQCQQGACACGTTVAATTGTTACNGSAGDVCCGEGVAQACVQNSDILCGCGALPSCPDGEICCSDLCIDTQTDAANCGACGTTCRTNESCVEGTCLCGATPCPVDGVCCQPSGGDPYCTSLDNSIDNCGACFITCGPGEHCATGLCTCGTTTGTMQAACAWGEECCGEGDAAACTDPADPSCGCGTEPPCTAGLLCCGAACIDPTADDNNCGSCGRQCSGDEDCIEGSCVDDSNCRIMTPRGMVPVWAVIVMFLVARRRRERPSARV